MKRKIDFVTNSSSTSFIGWGTIISDEIKDLPAMFQTIMYDKYCKSESGSWKNNDLTFDDYLIYSDWVDDLDGILREYNIQCQITGYDGVVIGLHPKDLDENKTLKETKDEIKRILENLGLKISNIEFIEKTWYS